MAVEPGCTMHEGVRMGEDLYIPFSTDPWRPEITWPFIVENENQVLNIESDVTVSLDTCGLTTAIAIKKIVDAVIHELTERLSSTGSAVSPYLPYGDGNC